jgi:hypothetical protein
MARGLITQALHDPRTQEDLAKLIGYLRVKDEEKKKQEEAEKIKKFFAQSRPIESRSTGLEEAVDPATGKAIPSIGGEGAMQTQMQRRDATNLRPEEEIDLYNQAPRHKGVLDAVFDRAQKEKPSVFGGEYSGYYEYDPRKRSAKALVKSKNRPNNLRQNLKVGVNHGKREYYEDVFNPRTGQSDREWTGIEAPEPKDGGSGGGGLSDTEHIRAQEAKDKLTEKAVKSGNAMTIVSGGRQYTYIDDDGEKHVIDGSPDASEEAKQVAKRFLNAKRKEINMLNDSIYEYNKILKGKWKKPPPLPTDEVTEFNQSKGNKIRVRLKKDDGDNKAGTVGTIDASELDESIMEKLD